MRRSSSVAEGAFERKRQEMISFLNRWAGKTTKEKGQRLSSNATGREKWEPFFFQDRPGKLLLSWYRQGKNSSAIAGGGRGGYTIRKTRQGERGRGSCSFNRQDWGRVK